MKVFLAFILACFIVGGIPTVHRMTIKRPVILGALSFVVAVSLMSLRVLL